MLEFLLGQVSFVGRLSVIFYIFEVHNIDHCKKNEESIIVVNGMGRR